MSARIGAAGRQARQLATVRRVRQRMPTTDDEPLPLQKTASNARAEQRSAEPAGNSPTERAEHGEVERETETPTPQDVAERVYRLFVQELRREGERHGRYRAG